MKTDTYIQDKNKKSNETKLWKFNGKNVNLHYLDDKIFSGVRFNKICQKQINKKKCWARTWKQRVHRLLL